MDAPVPQRLLTRKEAADYLGVKPDTLAQWTWLGKGPKYVKVGGLAKYSTEHLEEWVTERTRHSSNPARDAELRAGVQPAPKLPRKVTTVWVKSPHDCKPVTA